MKIKECFFYTDKIEEIKNKNSGLINKVYTVIKVKVFKNNLDYANRKAKTLGKKLNISLENLGWFVDTAKPYNFLSDYKIINCPDNTKISAYTKQDIFIQKLIENESY